MDQFVRQSHLYASIVKVCATKSAKPDLVSSATFPARQIFTARVTSPDDEETIVAVKVARTTLRTEMFELQISTMAARWARNVWQQKRADGHDDCTYNKTDRPNLSVTFCPKKKPKAKGRHDKE
jgi:hypothetical protein